jgi:putative ABC transport system permease protein
MNDAAYIPIGLGQMALAAAAVLVNVGLSMAFRLGLTRSLLVASVRMTAQLLLVGLVLAWVFDLEHPLPILGIALVMAALASVSAVGRIRRRFAGVYWNSLVSTLSAAFLVTGFALVGILRVEPWYDAQYLIPLLGMVLGNVLNGISLSLDRFTSGVASDAETIELYLAMGATGWEAAHDLVADALRVGMIPTINTMMVMGIVSLPGMMTGQILAGALPADAVRYQIVIMFLITSATAIGSLGMVLLAYLRLFDRRGRLRLDRLIQASRR